MASRVDDVLNRLASLHAGFRLVEFEEVGLPFFELRLDVMAQKRHELPIIDEFVMHLAHSGLRSSVDIGGMLGLDPALVQRSVVSLLQSDYIDYPIRSGGREVVLTQLGTKVLEERMDQVPVRAELHIGFDRLLWKLSTTWMRDWEAVHSFKQSGARAIPARRKRRPEVEEVDLPTLNRMLAGLPHARRAQIDYDILQVLNLGARTKVLPALMLVFVADDHSTARVSFAIDGHHSPEHDRAFEDIDGLNRLGINPADPASLDQDRPELPDDLEALQPEQSTTDALAERRRATKVALDAALAEAAVEELAVARVQKPDRSGHPEPGGEHIDDLRRQLEKLETLEEALPLRPISTFEHRLLLEDAIQNARQRLLVISPWIRSSVVDKRFLERLNELCVSGVRVHIGYGIRKNDVEGHDESAIKALAKLARRHTNLVVRDMGNTHAKVLVWDDRMVLTSFNWLSFRGDPHRRYRQEAGIFVGERSYVDREYERHRTEIESS